MLLNYRCRLLEIGSVNQKSGQNSLTWLRGFAVQSNAAITTNKDDSISICGIKEEEKNKKNKRG